MPDPVPTRLPAAFRSTQDRTEGNNRINRIGGIAAALALTAIATWLTVDLAFARIEVAAVLILCFGLQLRFPEAWLVYLPALLPVFDLALWSGRLYIDELDILVLATAAAHFWHASWTHRQPFPSLNAKGGIIIGVVFASFMLSMAIGAFPLSYPDATQLGNYLSPWNALRVAKSIVWAILLLGPLQWCLARDARRAGTLFILGTSLGLVLVGLVVLWERGVFLAIAQSGGLYAGRWNILGALLDFTGSYRATALFSELHTGGEAMDGYLALAAPIAAAGALSLRGAFARSFCILGLALGTYAIMAGFSRSLYAAYGGALIFVIGLTLARTARSGLAGKYTAARVLAALTFGEVALFAAFDHGGWIALMTAIAIAAGALGVSLFLGDADRGRAGILLGAIFLVGGYALFHAFVTSRYNVVDAFTAGLWAAPCAVALVVLAWLVGRNGTALVDYRPAIGVLFAVFAAVNLVAVPASEGTRMSDRLLTTSADAETRWEHWREAARLIGPNWNDYVLGMGLGSFPRLYFREGVGPESKASFRYENSGTRSWLQLGVGDFNITQKIPLKPDTDYRLSLMALASAPGARLIVKLCPKLILYSDRYTPGCPVFDIRPGSLDTWVGSRFAFNSGALGRDGVLGWPITLLLNNGSDQSAVDVTDIVIDDGKGNIVANGDFSAGGDRWILISDFEHLAWHIKNLYLEIFFESGAVGLSVFLFVTSLALVAAIRMARRDVIGIALGGAMTGFLLVGFFGSVFDNPRPSLLFFVVLFWALQRASPREGGEHAR